MINIYHQHLHRHLSIIHTLIIIIIIIVIPPPCTAYLPSNRNKQKGKTRLRESCPRERVNWWKRLFNIEVMVEEGVISEEDLNLFKYVDSVNEAWQFIRSFYEL